MLTRTNKPLDKWSPKIRLLVLATSVSTGFVTSEPLWAGCALIVNDPTHSTAKCDTTGETFDVGGPPATAGLTALAKCQDACVSTPPSDPAADSSGTEASVLESQYSLTIQTGGTGSGKLCYQPSDISGIPKGGEICTDATAGLSKSLNSAAWYLLTYQADANSKFDGISGSNSQCQKGLIFLIQDTTCTAYFTDLRPRYTLSITTTGTGKVTAQGIDCGTDCTETFVQGTKVALSAVIEGNSQFQGWSGGCVGLETTTTISLDKDTTCQATFITKKLDQVITNFAPASSATAGTDATLTATGGDSGQLVTFASTTPDICTVSGTTVTFLKAGTCTVTADQAGNDKYNPAKTVTATISVSSTSSTTGTPPPIQPSKQDQVITHFIPTGYAFTVGQSAVLSANGGGSGNLVAYESLTPENCTVSNNTVTFHKVGTCKVSANQSGNDKYNSASQVVMEIQVNPALESPSPTPSNWSLVTTSTVGNRLELTTTGESAVFSTTTPEICTVSGKIANFIAPGTCTVTATQAGNATSTVVATITVVKKEPPPETTPTTTPVPTETTSPPVLACPDIKEENGVLIVSASCDANGQVFDKPLKIKPGVSISNLTVTSTVDNQGFLSNITIGEKGEVKGGTLSGSVNNQGNVCDVQFVGSSFVGGTVCGKIRNESKVGACLKEVTAWTDTEITGCVEKKNQSIAVTDTGSGTTGNTAGGSETTTGNTAGGSETTTGNTTDTTTASGTSTETTTTCSVLKGPTLVDDVCDGGGQTIDPKTRFFGEKSVTTNMKLGHAVQNLGTMGDITLTADGLIEGGVLTGTVSGGNLSGTITNQGTLKDVQLAYGTQITGGQLAGTVKGSSPVNVLLDNVAIQDGATIDNLLLKPNVRIGNNVTAGSGVYYCRGQAMQVNAAGGQITDYPEARFCFNLLVGSKVDKATPLRVKILLAPNDRGTETTDVSMVAFYENRYYRRFTYDSQTGLLKEEWDGNVGKLLTLTTEETAEVIGAIQIFADLQQLPNDYTFYVGYHAADKLVFDSWGASPQIQALSGAQIRTWTAAEIAGLTATQIVSLTSVQIQALTKDQLSWLSKDQVSMLTIAQISQLTKDAISGLTDQQISWLSQDQIAGLSKDQIAGLSKDAIAGLSKDAIAGLTGYQILGLSKDQVSGLSKDQISGLSKDQISGLSKDAIAGLTKDQISWLSKDTIAGLSKDTIAGLSKDAIAGLTQNQISGLTQNQISGLLKDQISGLSKDQISGLTKDQISGLSKDAISGLTKDQISGLSKDTIAGLSKDAISGLTKDQLSWLTKEQIAGLTKDAIAGLTKDAIAGLTKDQIAGLTKDQIAGLTKDAIAGLSKDQRLWLLSGLTKDAIAGLTWGQIISGLTKNQISGLTKGAISGLSKDQISGLSKDQISWLSKDAISGLTKDQISWLSKDQISWLTKDQISWLSKDQKAALDARKKELGIK